MLSDKSLGRASVVGMVGLALCVSGCIDNDYNLNDIDTTVQINVNNLVLPIKMEPVELENVIDADSSTDPDASEFRYDEATGDYFILSTGEFNSDPITIAGIYVEDRPSETKSIETPLAVGDFELSELPGVDLQDLNYEFDYTFDHVDDYIEEIDVIAVENLSLRLDISTSSPEVALSGLRFHLPEGLVCSSVTSSTVGVTPTYNISTGVLLIDGSFTNASVVINADSIHVMEAGGSFDRASSTFVFANTIGLRSGTVSSSIISASEQISVKYDLSALNVTAVSGKISYDVEVDDSNISLTDLPDELRQDGTNLALVNPQIYLNLTNPFAENGVYAQTGIDIYQVRNGQVSSEPAARLAKIDVGGNATEQFAEQIICLAPTEPQNPYERYMTFTEFTGLGSVVAGNGLPDELQVRFSNAGVPNGTRVKNFPIGRNDNQEVTGTYSFYAPLALKENSTISYTGTTNEWDIDDADDLFIDLMEVTADVINDVPLAVQLTALPLDKEGKEMTHVTVEPAEVAADGEGKVVIRISAQPGTSIVGIDGLEYTAKVVANGSEKVLNKNMKITLNNIKVKVNGYYKSTL